MSGDQRRLAEQLRHRPGIQGGGHDQQAQVIAQLAQIQAQGQGQIGMDGAFVEFIKDDQPHPGKFRVVLDAPGQYPLGEHLDAGGRR